MNRIIENLISAKKRAGITLKQISERTGISQGTINKLFSGGIASVKTHNLEKLAQVLGTTTEKLMYGSESRADETLPEKTTGVLYDGAGDKTFGFVKCAALTNEVRVCDTQYNADSIVAALKKAVDGGVRLAVFPELCITAYTAGDLVFQPALLSAAAAALSRIAKETARLEVLFFVGLPLRADGKIYNTAAAVCKGEILGFVPKTNLPNYNEFYEKRNFCEAPEQLKYIDFGGKSVPFGTDIIFKNLLMPSMKVSCEICEDVWVPNPPSVGHSLSGATVIVNLSASNEVAGKEDYRREMIEMQSSKCLCGYVYASSGAGESTTDVVFGGHDLICEAGRLLSESKPFGDGVAISDIDCDFMEFERSKKFHFAANLKPHLTVEFSVDCKNNRSLTRTFSPFPFVPSDKDKLRARCESVLGIASCGLEKRLIHTGAKKIVIGVSGGLDSTLALIIASRAIKRANRRNSDIIAVTMPCFGTTDRTKNNAKIIAELLKTDFIEINISKSVKRHLDDIGHSGEVDVTLENAQARERTQVLMDFANKVGGFVVGTGDLSELALGWATYNGDHMSMYGVNASIPKTLVKEIVLYEAENFGGKLGEALADVADTPISPELTPNGQKPQLTEQLIGPYDLNDFFLYYLIKHGFEPSKVLFIAVRAFEGKYGAEEIRTRLRNFIGRFFAQQYKRSCLPDGPKTGALSLSPRGDFRMPSDAVKTVWLKELDGSES